MIPIFAYAFKTIICSGIFYILYRILVENRTNFLFCRMYLILTAVVAALIPALKIPVYAGEIIQIPARLLTTVTSSATAPIGEEVMGPVSSPPPYPTLVYGGICILFLALLVYRLVRIAGYKKGARRSLDGRISIYESERIVTPFSFMRNIFLPSSLSRNAREQIIAHESGHVMHNHSMELLVMEVLKVLFWFNPFVWLGRRSLTEVHEYEADDAVISKGHDADDYKNLLLAQLFGYSPDISNGFACSGTKKRFLMMNKNKPGPRSVFRVLAAVPLAAGMLTVFSFTNKAASIVYTSADGSQTEDIHSVIEELLLPATVEPDNAEPESSPETRVRETPVPDNPRSRQLSVGEIDSLKKVMDQAAEELRKINIDSLERAMKDARASMEEARKAMESNRHLIDSIRMNLPRPELLRAMGLSETDISKLYQDLDLATQAIRSRPLIVIDGEVKGRIDINSLDPETFESVSILKDESATQVYGNEGRAGVIEITTKGDDDEEPFIVVENMPRFQDGDLRKFLNWVGDELRPYVKDRTLNGKVILTFIVDKEGKVIRPQILETMDPETDAEVIRVLLSSPAWTPGTQRGHKVNVRLNIPVGFASE